MSIAALPTTTPIDTVAPLKTAPKTLSLGSAHVIHGVTWDDYVRYREHPDNRGLRMTYDNGVLEIMTLSYFHETVSALIDRYIFVWTLHHRIKMQPSGSMTLRSKPLDKGLEGD